jgi:hypothetical protein
MRSQFAVRLGVQDPTILHLPPDVVSLAAAVEAIDLANAYGVADGHPLSGSQEFTLRAGLGERADGSWAATAVADFKPRQGGGKSDTIAARELAGLVLFGEQLIIHTAHEFPTANESFLRLVAVFENWDDLRAKVERIRYANGEQGIELLSGQRLKYRARTGGSGRGFAKADLVVYDEAQHLQAEHLAASGPARAANPNSQSWYAGSGGLSTSRNAWRMRRRALEGDAGRLAYVENSGEVVSIVDGRVVSTRPDVEDREAWERAIPGLGRWVLDETLVGLLDELGPELFARELLCVWDPEPGDEGEHAIPNWSVLTDPGSSITSHHRIALDVSPDRRFAALGAAGRRGDGRLHVEVIEHRPGTDWVLDVAVRSWRLLHIPVRVQTGSPAASFVAPLREAGVEVVEVSSAEYAQATGMVLDAAAGGVLHHVGGSSLNAAVRGAVLRESGDVVAWGRRTSRVDISTLCAVTIAAGGVPAAPSRGLFAAVT